MIPLALFPRFDCALAWGGVGGKVGRATVGGAAGAGPYVTTYSIRRRVRRSPA